MKKLLILSIISITFFGCPKDCFEDPNLIAPPFVNNVIVKQNSPEPIYIGQQFFPYGSSIIAFNSINRFFSLTRTNQFGVPITFWWNEQTPPPFSPLGVPPFNPILEGEMITYHVTIFNNKVGEIGCIFESAREIESILKVRVRAMDGEIVGTQTITQTKFDVPAGQYAVFGFPFTYEGDGNYELNVRFSADGLIETDTIDNNYNVELMNLGSGG